MNVRLLARLVVALLLLAALENWRNLRMVVYASEPVTFLVGAAWIGLLIISAVGLWRGKPWGAYFLLVLVLYNTIMLSTPLIPAIMDVFRLRGPAALAGVNFIMFAAGVILARMLSRAPGRKPQPNKRMQPTARQV